MAREGPAWGKPDYSCLPHFLSLIRQVTAMRMSCSDGALGAFSVFHAAFHEADIARLQPLIRLFDPLRQLAGTEGFQICGFETGHFACYSGGNVNTVIAHLGRIAIQPFSISAWAIK